jgi:hypothetical protein
MKTDTQPNTNTERVRAWHKAYKNETPQQVILRLEAERGDIYMKSRYRPLTTQEQGRLTDIQAALTTCWEIVHIERAARFAEPHHAWEQPR